MLLRRLRRDFSRAATNGDFLGRCHEKFIHLPANLGVGYLNAGASPSARTLRVWYKCHYEDALIELNADLRSSPPSHAAMADGCVVKHKIECVGNADGTFNFEAGAPVRQVAEHTPTARTDLMAARAFLRSTPRTDR
jgi:hypothetical protein